MRNIVINKNTLPTQQPKIEYKCIGFEEDENELIYTFQTPMEHGLTDGESVYLLKKKQIVRENGEVFEKTSNKTMNINFIDKRTFTLKFSKYTYALIQDLTQEDDEKTTILFTDTLPNNLVYNEKEMWIVVNGVEYRGVSLDLETEINGELQIEDGSSNKVVFDTLIKDVAFLGSVYVKNTWHMQDDNGTFDDKNIEMFINGLALLTCIPLSINTSFSVGDKNNTARMFLEDIKSEILPEVIDNEKRQFSPAIKRKGYFKFAQEIVFNLHFRERTDFSEANAFRTGDEMVWNGFTISERTNSLVKNLTGKSDDLADELDKIGFTEDDIKYQKNKLKKSFIRLSFYSSNNPLSRELLYYSTIFLDTNALYKTYGQIINKGISDIFNEKEFDKALRLACNFTVRNKYDSRRSSEGFYLYLFPNEVEENTERTIYMKVEFNHAGYGKMVPMMLPRSNGDNGAPLQSNSPEFPLSFLLIDGDGKMDNNFSRYSECVMIPIKIKYDEYLNSYIYYFPWFNRNDEEKITINLWEPRMRGYVNGSN
jgi:5-bromo-4-chloroindolyl phosphate hydrolysis protein